MKEQILKLKAEGKTYNQIQEILGCSRGTISYHCGKGQKDKAKIRASKNSKSVKYIVSKKVDSFLGRRIDKKYTHVKRGTLHKEMVESIINNPICYMTGENIDLSKPETYCLDHIIPFYISEDNGIDNMGLCLKEANSAKSYMELEEFIDLCKKVIKHLDK